MGWLSNKIRREDLKRGDHIYTWRTGFSYSHHGIYEGDGWVIHLTRDRVPGLSPFYPSEGPVVSCSIQEFLSGGELYRYEYGVNALFFLIKRPGTCTRAHSDPPEQVMYRASFLLTDGFGDYDLSNNNCEDFALYCKTELLDVKGSRKTGTSGQIASIVAIITTIYAILFMPYGFLPTSFTGLTLMFCFFYCNSRLHFDAGSRVTYVLEKVSVEKFKQLSYPDTIAWMEHGTKWIPTVAILAFIFWYWTPKSIVLVCIRSFFLYVLLSLLIFDYLRNHRFKLYVYIFNNLMALIVWHWTPESNGYQGIRTFLLHNYLIVLVIDPLINRHLKLWLYIQDVIWLFDFWYWTPESTILQWIRLFLLNVSFCELVANVRNHSVKSSVYILNLISGFIIWYWTPETTILGWLRLLLLYGLYTLIVINPNFRWKLGNYVDDTIYLFGLWYCWTPGSRILLCIKIYLLINLFSGLVFRFLHLISSLCSFIWVN